MHEENLNPEELEFSEEVEFCLKNGNLTDSHRRLLTRRAKQLNISEERAKVIEQLILKTAIDHSPEENEYMEEVKFCLEPGSIDEEERLLLNKIKITNDNYA